MRLFFLLISIAVFVGSPCRGAGEEYFTLQINLLDVSSKPLPRLGDVHVELTQFPSGKRPSMEGEATELPGKSGTYEARIRKAKSGETATIELEKQAWQIGVSVAGYRNQFIGPLRLRADGDKILPAEKSIPVKTTLLRDGLYWQPEFACHTTPVPKNLPVAVRKLKRILNGDQDEREKGPRPIYLQPSQPIWRNLFGKPEAEYLGTLSGIEFHKTGTEKYRQQTERARAALLNIVHALDTKAEKGCSQSSQPDWLRWIDRIVLISEERFIARVEPELYEAVARLEQNAPAYSCQSTVKASAALHTFDDPKIREMVRTDGTAPIFHSVKTPLCQGNVQITVAKFKTATNNEVIFADFDIDENFGAGAHFMDVLIHASSGRGTDAYEVYEMLLARGGHKPAELGYELIRLAEKPKQCAEPGRKPFSDDGTAANPD